MKREDPLLLPICQFCGKYKGVGLCNDSNCEGSEASGGKSETKMRSDASNCSLCKNTSIVSCSRCGRGFCEIHGKEEVKGHLMKWDQRVGTCTICDQPVCENCWILEGDGLFTCLLHHDGHPHD